LSALHYDPAPRPPIRAIASPKTLRARLGQRLFFDPAFSGRLLEGDNDGSSATLASRRVGA